MLAIIADKPSIEIVDSLINCNADVSLCSTSLKETVMHVCAKYGPHEIFDYLICKIELGEENANSNGQKSFTLYQRRLKKENTTFKERGN